MEGGGFVRFVWIADAAVPARWSAPQLRRTLRTTMSCFGYDHEIQRLCVGQKLQGIDQVPSRPSRSAVSANIMRLVGRIIVSTAIIVGSAIIIAGAMVVPGAIVVA